MRLRNKITRRIALSLLALVAIMATGTPARAVAADVSVHASIDSLTLWMGEQTRIRLEVAQDAGDQVWLLPTFADTLVRGIEILEVSRPDTTDLGQGRIQIDRSLLVTSFYSGFFYIPPFRYLSGVDTLTTEALSLKILPMDVDTTQSIVDIKGVRAPSSAWWLLLWDNMPLWGWIVLLVILLAALAYIAYRIYVKRFARKREDVSPEELLPPHEKALMALSQLRDEKLWQGGREKEYYTHLTDILREYLSGRFGIQAMEMTSSQIVEALRSNQETRLLNKQMKEILEMADFVKFAKLKPAPDDNESAMRNAVSFVEETRPQEVPAGDPATPADGSPADSAVQGAPAAKETTPEVSDTQSESDWEKYGPSNKPRL